MRHASDFEVWVKTVGNIKDIIAHREHGGYGEQYKVIYEGYTLGEATWVQKKYCKQRWDLIDKYEAPIKKLKGKTSHHTTKSMQRKYIDDEGITTSRWGRKLHEAEAQVERKAMVEKTWAEKLLNKDRKMKKRKRELRNKSWEKSYLLKKWKMLSWDVEDPKGRKGIERK